MKKWFAGLALALILGLSLLPGKVQAAGDVAINEENFPDADFRAVVSGFDKSGEGILSAAEIGAVTDIHCSGNGRIADLTGIEHFTGLVNLYCTGNRLKHLDLSANTALQAIYCFQNQLETLVLPRTESMVLLLCYDNRLTELDLSGVPKLSRLECQNNLLTHLDLSAQVQLNKLTYNSPGPAIREGTQPDLDPNKVSNVQPANGLDGGRLHFDDSGRITYDYDSGNPYHGSLRWTIREAGIAVDEVNFPDSCFRETYVAGYDKNNNGQLSPEEIATATSIIIKNEPFQVVESLQGIEYFTELTRLECSLLRLKSLDLSQNKKLETVRCTNNPMTSLNLSGCANLTEVVCQKCSLTELNLSGCSALKQLYCDNNQLTELDLTGCSGLETLFCYSNQLTELDLTRCPELGELFCYYNQLTELDLSNCPELGALVCYHNQLTGLDLSHRPKLRKLECEQNRLTELDLSGCPKLDKLECQDNQLLGLNLSGCEALKTLDYSRNRLVSLDLSGCPLLTLHSISGTDNSRTIPEGGAIADWLPGFDLSKVSKIQGGSLENGVIHFTAEQLTYEYNMENEGMVAGFVLTPAGDYLIALNAAGNKLQGSVREDCTLCVASYSGNGRMTGARLCPVSAGKVSVPYSYGGGRLWVFLLNGSHRPICGAFDLR